MGCEGSDITGDHSRGCTGVALPRGLLPDSGISYERGGNAWAASVCDGGTSCPGRTWEGIRHGPRDLVPVLVGALLRVVGRSVTACWAPSRSSRNKPPTASSPSCGAWWSRDKVASDELERFQDEPDMYRPVVEARLVKKLTAEPDMQREFEALITGMGPQVEVFQKIAQANGVTGARIEELVRGHVHVEQQMDTAENVTGAEIKRLG